MIEFEAPSHTYSIDGVVVPHVTEVAEILEDFSRVPWDYLEAARRFGNHVHDACALLVRDALDWSTLDANLVPYIVGAKRFLEESGCTPLASEIIVGSKRHMCAGRLDLIAEWQSGRCLIDWKATATVPRGVGPQTAGYERLYREGGGQAIRRRYCVQLKPNDYRAVHLTDPADWSYFQSALNVTHWRKRHVLAA